jgi:hypothetical protein
MELAPTWRARGTGAGLGGVQHSWKGIWISSSVVHTAEQQPKGPALTPCTWSGTSTAGRFSWRFSLLCVRGGGVETVSAVVLIAIWRVRDALPVQASSPVHAHPINHGLNYDPRNATSRFSRRDPRVAQSPIPQYSISALLLPHVIVVRVC